MDPDETQLYAVPPEEFENTPGMKSMLKTEDEKLLVKKSQPEEEATVFTKLVTCVVTPAWSFIKCQLHSSMCTPSMVWFKLLQVIYVSVAKKVWFNSILIKCQYV